MSVRRGPGSRPAVSRRGAALLAAGATLWGIAPAAAQLRPSALENVTILTGNGRNVERGTLVMLGGRITDVGAGVERPFLARSESLEGRFVTPGLIDVWSTLGARLGESGDVLARAEDAFDRFAEQELRAALAQGVTAVYVPARARDGFGGLGAVIRLKPGADLDEIVVDSGAALCATLGSDAGQSPVARLRSFSDFRKRWREALDYRAAREAYEQDLEEYEKKLKERAAGEKAGGAEPSERPDAAPAGDHAATDGNDASDDPTQPQPRRRPARRDGRGEREAPASGAAPPEKKDELKKPVEPPPDRRSELLLRVIDGELPLRVEAHRPEDILNALEVAREFNCRLIIEGASGAHRVADRLADADVAVILGPPPGSMRFEPGPRRHQSPNDLAALLAAGVKVYFGSGPEPATPNLALHAAWRVAHGMDAEAALERITSGAAELLGIEAKIGTLARGMPADLVVWSDHPFSPGARVERVYIAGEEVWRRDADD